MCTYGMYISSSWNHLHTPCGVGVCVALWSFGYRVERTLTSVGSWMGAHHHWRQKYRLDSCGPTTKPAWILVDTQKSERNKERRWWCDAGKPGTTIISESGWREAVTGSIFGCPFTLAPPSRRLDERPLIQRRGKKKNEKVKKDMKVKVAFLSARKKL